MKHKIYQLDAFTNTLFGGNPAAVVPLIEWLPDETLHQIAAENNLAETAFFIPKGKGYHIRWFSPTVEVDLCGHATLASSFVLFNHENFSGNEIEFESRSGILKVKKNGDWFTLDFPAYALTPSEATADVIEAIGKMPTEVYQYKNDLLLIYHDQTSVEMLNPDFRKLQASKYRAVLVTAPGNESDLVYRFFGPNVGIDEDPATGSAQCALVPYWSKRLNKHSLTSIQVSKRQGFLKSTIKDDRVEISGQAVLYMTGEINIPSF